MGVKLRLGELGADAAGTLDSIPGTQKAQGRGEALPASYAVKDVEFPTLVPGAGGGPQGHILTLCLVCS